VQRALLERNDLTSYVPGSPAYYLEMAASHTEIVHLGMRCP
jgi:hypothetical protein